MEGVSKTYNGKYRSYIRMSKMQIYLGQFETKEEAYKEHLRAKEEKARTGAVSRPCVIPKKPKKQRGVSYVESLKKYKVHFYVGLFETEEEAIAEAKRWRRC